MRALLRCPADRRLGCGTSMRGDVAAATASSGLQLRGIVSMPRRHRRAAVPGAPLKFFPRGGGKTQLVDLSERTTNRSCDSGKGCETIPENHVRAPRKPAFQQPANAAPQARRAPACDPPERTISARGFDAGRVTRDDSRPASKPRVNTLRIVAGIPAIFAPNFAATHVCAPDRRRAECSARCACARLECTAPAPAGQPRARRARQPPEQAPGRAPPNASYKASVKSRQRRSTSFGMSSAASISLEPARQNPVRKRDRPRVAAFRTRGARAQSSERSWRAS